MGPNRSPCKRGYQPVEIVIKMNRHPRKITAASLSNSESAHSRIAVAQ